eukprot:1160968-Pelagomonas_calceolata.AAC.2
MKLDDPEQNLALFNHTLQSLGAASTDSTALDAPDMSLPPIISVEHSLLWLPKFHPQPKAFLGRCTTPGWSHFATTKIRIKKKREAAAVVAGGGTATARKGQHVHLLPYQLLHCAQTVVLECQTHVQHEGAATNLLFAPGGPAAAQCNEFDAGEPKAEARREVARELGCEDHPKAGSMSELALLDDAGDLRGKAKQGPRC